jgi:hypothetical protein
MNRRVLWALVMSVALSSCAVLGGRKPDKPTPPRSVTYKAVDLGLVGGAQLHTNLASIILWRTGDGIQFKNPYTRAKVTVVLRKYYGDSQLGNTLGNAIVAVQDGPERHVPFDYYFTQGLGEVRGFGDKVMEFLNDKTVGEKLRPETYGDLNVEIQEIRVEEIPQ